MAAYPSYNQVLGSLQNVLDDRVLDQDVNGAVHIRSFFPSRISQFMVKHYLTPAQLATLLAFYDTNRLLTFTFVWYVDNVTYTCVFGAPPKFVPNDPGLYDVVVDLREQS